METFIAFIALVFGSIVCLGVVITAAGVGIYFVNRRLLIPALVGNTDPGPILSRWVADQGGELVALAPVTASTHPFTDRFGVGLGKWPGRVFAIQVRTRQQVYSGHAYMRMGLFGRLDPQSLEVIWG
jgi:hypothetical protein